jgi:hypothetical protein
MNMPKNIGIIKLKGTIAGMTFYVSDGENLVKLAKGPDKETIMNHPAFKRTRENMSEFGGAAKAGKALRAAFADVAKKMGTRYLSSRVTEIMKKIITLCPGVTGKRPVDMVAYKSMLKGFEFNNGCTFGSVFIAPFNEPSFNSNRDVVSLTLPEFNTDKCILYPHGSTHFKIILACGMVSNFAYDDEVDGYIPLNPELNEIRGLDISQPISLGGMSGGDITLHVDFGIGSALPPDVTVVAAIGIEFYQEINAQLYELASKNAMQIVALD